MRKILLSLTGLCFCLFLTRAAGSQPTSPSVMSITGSTAIQPRYTNHLASNQLASNQLAGGQDCSTGGTVAATVNFVNKRAAASAVYWVGYDCTETLYATLEAEQNFAQNTFVDHLWRFRNASDGQLLYDQRISGTGTVEISDPQIIDSQHVYLPLIAGKSAAVRQTSDQPDALSGYQVHLVYALPSDGVDHEHDLSGALATSVAAFQKWLVGQTGGPKLRIDSADGQLDISFVRFSQNDATIKARGVFVREAIQEELIAQGFSAPKKLYAVYYDGSSSVSCGGGAWPPLLVGSVGALYLLGEPPGGIPCANNHFSTSEDTPGYLEFAMIHEIFHTLGVAPDCAPHHTRSGHVSDATNDLMYAGDAPWNLVDVKLDFNNDDYYAHNNPNCFNLAKSAFLEPLPENAEAPPGWE